ncbi:MAG: four helix bundle protein [Patescibacteria group bacterium]
MRNPLGYKTLRTYQQGEEIYELTRKFTALYLDPIKDSRLIGHMNDSGRSVPRNIAEGYNWNNTKKYYEFLGFSFGSLIELLEDYLELEKDIKGGLRKTRDNNGALRMISQAIKLCMGEKTMLKSQMDKIESMVGEQGLLSQNQRVARNMAEDIRKNKIFDAWLEDRKKGIDRPLKF